jgi:hypothetical protein
MEYGNDGTMVFQRILSLLSFLDEMCIIVYPVFQYSNIPKWAKPV